MPVGHQNQCRVAMAVAIVLRRAFGRPGRERRAVGHGGDGVGLDYALARWITPDLARISVDPFGRGRREVEAVHVGPLLDDLVGVLRLHHLIGAAVPHRYARPRTLVWRRGAHEIAPFARRAGPHLTHALERLVDIGGGAVWQTGDDGAGGERVGIGGEHDGGHRAAGAIIAGLPYGTATN